MPQEDKDSRTEQATPKKKKDERKKGNVFSSKDIVGLATLLVGFYGLQLLFPYMIERLGGILNTFAEYSATTKAITPEFTGQLYTDLVFAFVICVVPLALAVTVAAIVATGAQTRFIFSGEVLKPKLSRLNPIEGFKKLFKLKSFVEVIKGTLKVVIIFWLLYSFVTSQIITIARTLDMELMSSVSLMLSAVMNLFFRIVIAFLAMSVLDFLYQRYDYNKELRMTKHEVKEEYKQLEGDPQVKGKIKEKQRAIAQSRMMQAVPSADVVIRNPTHFAVALRYSMDKDTAPVVVAKGADELALRIVRVAEEAGVYVTEEPELTRAIYAAADINEVIPFDFYKAVAEILAYVYQLKEDKTPPS